jgi:hypothetical protein
MMFNQGVPPSSSKPAQQHQTTADPSHKEQLWSTSDINLTAAKRQESHPIYTQNTPKPQRKILLYGENKSRFLFPLVRDRDIGIEAPYQNIVIESVTVSRRSATTMTGKQPAPNSSAAWLRLWKTYTRCCPRPTPPHTTRSAVIEHPTSN